MDEGNIYIYICVCVCVCVRIFPPNEIRIVSLIQKFEGKVVIQGEN
jgi:hypothetical protein